MVVKKFKPRTPSLRATALISFKNTEGFSGYKPLMGKKNSRAGRNSQGRITVRRRGGGVKQRYRFVDFVRDKIGVPGLVASIEYDPNRNARLALIHYRDGEKAYILAAHNMNVGSEIVNGKDAEINLGNNKPLEFIPLGTLVHNIELKPGNGGQMARSAGAYAQLMAKEKKMALLRLPSGELRKVQLTCCATIGQVGNLEYENRKLGKAGRSRYLGRRPKVRGVAMNPVDHPHGGGEGRTSGGRHPVTPWGKPTKGFKTRHNKRTEHSIVKKRK